MRLLLDTHTLLWFLGNNPRMGANARSLMVDKGNELLISPMSLFEIVVKISLGKMTLTRPFQEIFPSELFANDIRLLPVEVRHLRPLSSMPFHLDPFDRLLAATAMTDGSPLLSADTVFDDYGIRRIR